MYISMLWSVNRRFREIDGRTNNDRAKDVVPHNSSSYGDQKLVVGLLAGCCIWSHLVVSTLVGTP